MRRKMSQSDFMGLNSELLPGIHDDVTLHHISPKLSQRDGQILTKVSRDWQRAFQRRMVYNERVISEATEKFNFAFCRFKLYDVPWQYRIYLHSPRENCAYQVPPISGFPSGLPFNCQCVTLDGAIYVLGGRDPRGREVHALGLVGHQSQWKQCASMQEPRTDEFVAGVMDGKIFVFGGVSGGRKIDRCETYDPKVNEWSAIKPLPGLQSRLMKKVVAVGKELFVRGYGPFRPRDQPEVDMNDDTGGDETEDVEHHQDTCIEMVDPDLFIGDDDSQDELHDEPWIENIDPDLFRDDDLADCQWVHQDQHGFHNVLEKSLHIFNETNENEETLGSMERAPFLAAYDPVKDNWRVVERTENFKDATRLLGPMHAPSSYYCPSNLNLAFPVRAMVNVDVWTLSL